MAFCPNCGFAVDLSAPAGRHRAVSGCPRCGGAGLSGTEHRLDVVELSRVSAQVRRDEAAISDRSDERKRERYTIAAAADIDPAYVAKRWYVNDYDFGTKYLRQMVIRWVNIGAGRATAPAARSRAAWSRPRCSACARAAACSTRAAGVNRPEEHRAWCRYRKATDKHVRTIALTRTLTTQGAVIRLPQSVTVGDQFAIPSLAAALLLGLHEQIGGSPDHINIAAINEPVAGARRRDQRGAAAARPRPRRHRLPGRAGGPGPDVGPAAPGVGPGPRLPVPARAAARLPSLPASRSPSRRRPQPRLPARPRSGTCARS